MNKYKILNLFLAILLFLNILAACAERASTNEDTSKQESAVQSGKLEKYDLRIVTAGVESAEQQEVNEAISKKTEKELNINLQVTNIPWNDYINKIKLMSTAGEKFDIYLSFYSELHANIARNQCIPLNDLIEKYGQDIKKRIPEDEFAGLTVDGNLYGIPSVYLRAELGGPIIRKDLREKYNIPEIKDLSGVEKYFDAVVKNEGIPGFATRQGRFLDLNRAFRDVNYYDAGIGNDFYHYIAINPYKKPYKVENNFKTEMTRDIVKWSAKAYKNGWIAKDNLVTEDDKALFCTGKIGAITGDLYNLPEVDSLIRKNIPGAEIELVVINPEKKWVQLGPSNNFAMISSTSMKPERAMMFLNWLRKDRNNYLLYMNGIENKHWTAVGEDQCELINVTDMSKSPYNPSPWFAKDYRWDRTATIESQAYINAINFWKSLTPDKPKINFFTPDTMNIKKEMAQVSQVVLEKWLPVINGVNGTKADYNEAVAELDNAGMNKIIEDIQKQLDIWAAKNDR